MFSLQPTAPHSDSTNRVVSSANQTIRSALARNQTFQRGSAQAVADAFDRGRVVAASQINNTSAATSASRAVVGKFSKVATISRVQSDGLVRAAFTKEAASGSEVPQAGSSSPG